MNHQFADARLEELTLLSEIDRKASVTETPMKGPRRDMIAFLVAERFVNDLQIEWMYNDSEGFTGLPSESPMERKLNDARLRSLSRVLAGEEVRLELTHNGRVRLSELKQALRSGKTREPYGILWDGRHLQQDLQLAILEASDIAPLSIGFLDMNGLKGINDKIGHDAGDLALRAYFQAISTALGDRGEAYRVGGDEVIAILPLHDSQMASATLRTACLSLMSEQLKLQGRALPRLSVSVGIATTVEPGKSFTDLKHSTDQAMYRAKEEANKRENSPSAIAVDGDTQVCIVNPNS